MLDWRKIKDYIEKKNDICLSDYQTQILKAVIRGDIVYTARGCGRSTIYNGYADYLKEIVEKDTDRNISPEDFDSIFTANMLGDDPVFKENKMNIVFDNIKVSNPHMWERDFICKKGE